MYQLIDCAPEDFTAVIKNKKYKFKGKNLNWNNYLKWEKKFGYFTIEQLLVNSPYRFMANLLFEAMDWRGKIRFRTPDNLAKYLPDMRAETDDIAAKLLLLIGKKFVEYTEPEKPENKTEKVSMEKEALKQKEIIIGLLNQADPQNRENILKMYFKPEPRH